jgi:colicin import membrane protein
MSRKKRETRTDESSVNVALDELMGLEDERQRLEAEARRREEEEAEAARDEDERRRRLEAEARRRAEEEARLEAERLAREEEHRRDSEARERELRIRAEAQAEAMAREQATLMEKELELKRIEASREKAPAWFWPVAAVLFLGIAGVGGVVYANVTSSAQNQVREARRDLDAYSAETDHSIRRKPITYSTPNRSPIPVKPITSAIAITVGAKRR